MCLHRVLVLNRDLLRMDARRPAAAGRQFDFQFRGIVDLHFHFLIITGHAVGVYSVLISIYRKIAFGQEGKINFQFARRPICLRSRRNFVKQMKRTTGGTLDDQPR